VSEKLTRIRLPSREHFHGMMEWDENTVEHMIGVVRRHSARLRAEADALDAAADADFQIDVVRGPYVQHHVKELQRSTPSSPIRAGEETA